MQATRGDFLLSGVSTLALLSVSGLRAAPVHAVPEFLYEPGVDAMTAAVRTISSLIVQQGLIGIDFSDIRTVLKGGGRAAFGQGLIPTRRPESLGGI